MFDNDLEKRVEALELTINRLIQTIAFTNKHIEMLMDFNSAHEMLSDILIKAKIIDKKKYKEEYNKYLFHSKEARGILKELQRQVKDE